MIAEREASETFACFGSRCAVLVIGYGACGSATEAVAAARRRMLSWHEQFTRFEATSELSRLNRDPRAAVPVSAVMAQLAEAVVAAARMTGGLVDATLLRELEDAGYREDLRTSLPLALALETAPVRRPAGPSREARWMRISVDAAAGVVRRPPGVGLDAGGLAKGLFADLLAEELETHASFAVDCAGDLRVGGASGTERAVQVASPFDGAILHRLPLADAGIATSGIGRRSWLAPGGSPRHHSLDPATGRPAYTGVVQATTMAPMAVEAEIRSKAAVLSGPDKARTWLVHGGLIVFDDRSHEVVEPRG